VSMDVTRWRWHKTSRAKNIHTGVQVLQWTVDTSPFPSSPCGVLAMRASVALHARANLRMAAAHGDQQHAHRAGLCK
jgi:hypothetical protein